MTLLFAKEPAQKAMIEARERPSTTLMTGTTKGPSTFDQGMEELENGMRSTFSSED